MNKVKIYFLGASGTVTGSKFLLETPEKNILIDCGMFQGIKELRLLNWKEFPFPPEKIDMVVLTHGHLDHCGYLPRLVLQGFKGDIIAIAPTLEIAKIVLLDAAKIQEEDAARANEEHFSKHKPALAFYTVEDAQKTIEMFKPAPLQDWEEISENIKFRYQKNGHIIGSCFLKIEIHGKRIVFSGDVGRNADDLLENPSKPEWADYLFLESTYGDRLHPTEDEDRILTDCIQETLQENGNLIIPSFAVERLQTLMFKLWNLYKKGKIPHVPVFIDSPMGNRVLQVFRQFPNWHKLSVNELQAMEKHFNIITSYKETWTTIDDTRSKIVIAGSGMVTGGRVLTYLKYLIDRPETTVLLAGYQAEGTRGRKLQEGTQEVKIHGKYIPVKAKIKMLHGLSAHADQQELLDWLKEVKNIPEQTFLVHGEANALAELKAKIIEENNWNVRIPELNNVVEIKL